MFDTSVEWIAIFISCLIGVAWYVKSLTTYWNNKNVPYISFKLYTRRVWMGHFIANFYHQAKQSAYKHVGFLFFWQPIYMPVDPQVIRSILSKDFNNFPDRGMFSNEKIDPVGAHLFVIEGQKWKDVRAKLTPTFTSGKMKTMFQMIVNIADNLKVAVDQVSLSGEPSDAKQLFQCYTLDVIGSCAFGLDCNSFTNPDSEFRKYGNKTISGVNKLFLKSFFGFRFPTLAKLLQLRTTEKDVSDFFFKIVKETVEYREENSVQRNDFLQILINLKQDYKNANVATGLTLEEIAAQSFLFFIAGFETSSSTMAFCLYELACNPDIQEKVRDEMNLVLENYEGKLTYEAIMEMKCMRQVVDETLRKYPIVPILNRNCVADYKIPDTDVIIENRTIVFISVYGLHHDPEYFPDPEKFDPERFSEQNKAKIKPFTYLPFGDGPRNCIGLRFGLMQVQVGLAILLKSFSFSVNSKTISPLKMDPQSFVPSALGDLWLDVKKL